MASVSPVLRIFSGIWLNPAFFWVTHLLSFLTSSYGNSHLFLGMVTAVLILFGPLPLKVVGFKLYASSSSEIKFMILKSSVSCFGGATLILFWFG